MQTTSHPIEPLSLGASQILQCAVQAVRLLVRHPLRWFLLVLCFVITIELFRLFPFVGLVLKLAVSSLLGAQMLRLFAESERAGRPRWRTLLGVLRLPASSAAVLVVSALLPFTLAMIYVSVAERAGSAAYFFASAFDPQPPTELFFRVKIVMFAGAMPFTFFGAAVVLAGLRGREAAATGLRAAWRNPAVAVLLVAVTLAAEHALTAVPALWPGAGGIVLASLWLFVFLGWMLAWTYTLGATVLGIARGPAGAVAPASGTTA